MLEILNETLRTFDNDLSGILRNNYCDLLITGSAVLGDYAPGRGDIDFIVLLESDIADDQAAKLIELHETYRSDKERLVWQLEGCYYPKQIMEDRELKFVGFYVGTTRRGWKKIFENKHNVFDWIMLAAHPYSYKNRAYGIKLPSAHEIEDHVMRELASWNSCVDDISVPSYVVIQWAARVIFYMENSSIASKTDALNFVYEHLLKNETILRARAMRAPCDKALFEKDNHDSRKVARKLLELVEKKLAVMG